MNLSAYETVFHDILVIKIVFFFKEQLRINGSNGKYLTEILVIMFK